MAVLCEKYIGASVIRMLGSDSMVGIDLETDTLGRQPI